MVSDFLYRRWKCHFLAPQNGHFCQKCPSWDLKKRHFQCRYKKSETTFIIQTFPKNEDYSLWFHLLSLFRVGLDDFHFRALLALISEGKSDQNEKCNFAKEGVLISKNWRKQTHLKIQFYIEKHVWQKVLGNLSDIVVFSISPSIQCCAKCAETHLRVELSCSWSEFELSSVFLCSSRSCAPGFLPFLLVPY